MKEFSPPPLEYNEAAAILCDIERNVAVEKLRYPDLSVWPLVRLTLWSQLTNGAAAEEKAPKWLSRIGRKLQGASFIGHSLRWRVGRHAPAGALFLVRPNERRYGMIDGKAAAAFIDSLREFADRAELANALFDMSEAQEPYGDPQRLGFDLTVIDLREGLCRRWSRQPGRIAGFSALADYLRHAWPAIVLDEEKIVGEVDIILARKRLFKRILKRVAPRAIFFTCYYEPSCMAAILAARELGIQSVDVQHGQQGDYHGMYANWNDLPTGGYDLLPDVFWCWGAQSAARINRWSRSVWPAHRGVVGGNPWMARQIRAPGTVDEEARLERLLIPGKKHVLIALQPVSDPLPDSLIRAIAASASGMQWLVRLHPMMRGAREEEIRAAIARTGHPHVELDLSSSLPLAVLLKRMDFVITLWSSVAYEALLFGAHPLILHENGLKTFRNYIDSGLFSYATSSGEILDTLVRDKSGFNYREDIPYIETRENVIHEQLLKLTRADCGIEVHLHEV